MHRSTSHRSTPTQTAAGERPTTRAKAKSGTAGLVAALLLAVCASPAGAAAPPANAAASGAQHQSGVTAAAAAALAKQRGMKVADAKLRLAKEHALGEKAHQLEKTLGPRSGGSFLDNDGHLVVTTLDVASKSKVVADGVRAKMVDDSAARLDSIKNQLDRQASAHGAGAVHGWFVDVPTNTVVVTVAAHASDPSTAAMKKLAGSFGASVRIESEPAGESPKPAEWMVGGLEYNMPAPDGRPCSVGFNTFDAYNRPVVLTAGHCVRSTGMFTRNGYWIGNGKTSDFPGDDFGTFSNSYPTYWQPSSSVYLWNNTYAKVAGRWDNPPVGTTVCKSGRTTGLTCGRITALNASASYPEGIVSGLVRHDACVEGGDSGGSNISGTGNWALGLTSGASMIGGKCLSKFGQANVSYYQPVGEALSRNGLRLAL